MSQKKISLLIAGAILMVGCKTVVPIQANNKLVKNEAISIVDAGVTAGKVKIIQNTKDISLENYKFRWLLTCNGEQLQWGDLGTPKLNALNEAIMDINYHFIYPTVDGIYYLTVEAVDGDKVIASNQFKVSFVNHNGHVDSSKDPLLVEENNSELKIEGEDFKVEFSKRNGLMKELEYDDELILDWGPDLKDYHLKQKQSGDETAQYKLSRNRLAEHKFSSFDWREVSENEVEINVELVAEGVLKQKTTWNVYNTGVISHKSELLGLGADDLSNFVLEMLPRRRFHETSYFGRKSAEFPVVINKTERSSMTFENQLEQTYWVKLQNGSEGFKLLAKEPLKVYFVEYPSIKRDLGKYYLIIDRSSTANKKTFEFKIQPID